MMMDGFTSESRTRDGFQPRRPPDEDCDSDDISSSELDILERVEQDLRQLEINGPVIAELDSLEKFVPDNGIDAHQKVEDFLAEHDAFKKTCFSPPHMFERKIRCF